MLYILLLILFGGITIFEIVILVKKTGFFCLLMILLCTHAVTKGVSAAYLDTGIYNIELGHITWNVFAGPGYFFYLSIFFFFINVFVSAANKYIKENPPNFENAIDKDIRIPILHFLGIAMVAYLALDMAVSGIPLFSSGAITRFNFWSDYSRLPAAEVVSNFLTPVCVGLGFNQASNKIKAKDNKLEIVIVICVIAERLMLGYKVSGISDVIMGFIVGYFFRRHAASEQQKKAFIKSIKYLSVVMVVLVMTYVGSQIVTGEYSSIPEALDGLVERQFTISGHMEWAVFGDKEASGCLTIRDTRELLSPLQGRDELDPDIGVYGLMQVYAPAATYYNYLEHGVRFGASFITVSLFYNGILITLLGIILNAFIYSMFYLVFRCLAFTNHILTFAILYRVYLIFGSYISTTGTLTSFYRLNTIAIIGICMLLWIAENDIAAGNYQKAKGVSRTLGGAREV